LYLGPREGEEGDGLEGDGRETLPEEGLDGDGRETLPDEGLEEDGLDGEGREADDPLLAPPPGL
jgi:hypothetical protein